MPEMGFGKAPLIDQETPSSNGTPAVSSTFATQSNATMTAARSVVQSGARWFYWIAALSVLNSLLAISGAGIRFIFGLGITEIFDVVHEPAVKAVAFVISASVLGFFVLCGYFGSRLHKWAFVFGGLFYLADGALCFLFKDYLGMLFHVWALFRIYQGFARINEARPLETGVVTA